MWGRCPECGAVMPDEECQYDGMLEFDQRFVNPILDGMKTATIRKSLEAGLEPGKRVLLIAEDEAFAVAEVSATMVAPVEAVVDMEFDGHRSYRTVKELALALRQYYPEAYFGPKTDVAIITFTVVQDLT